MKKRRCVIVGWPYYSKFVANLMNEEVGGGQFSAPPGILVRNLGWQHDLQSAYNRCTAMIRFSPHDGLSIMVLEALIFGRHVLWTQDFPFTRRVSDFNDIEQEIRRLMDLHKQGKLQPQTAAAQRIHNEYAPARCMLRIGQARSGAARFAFGSQLAADAR